MDELRKLIENVELASLKDILLVLGWKLKRGNRYITWQNSLATAAPKDSKNIGDFYYR